MPHLADLGAAAAQLGAGGVEVLDDQHQVPILSDPAFSLGDALNLPTFTAPRQRLYSRLTLIIAGDRIEHAFYPIFPPDRHADEVLEWLRAHPRSG